MTDAMTDPAAAGIRTLLRRPSYLLFVSARFCGSLATTSQAAVLAWDVYETARRTRSVEEAAFAVGLIGLAQFLPLFALTLVAGEAADRYDRRRILIFCFAAQLLTAVALAVRSYDDGELWPIFVIAALFGSARAFFQPAASALGPTLVPPELLPRAIATNSLVVQLAMILGPAVGGLLCAVSPTLAYGVGAGLFATAAVLVGCVRGAVRPTVEAGRSRVAQIREGLGYVWRSKLVFGAISLDLFAVLLGGATALLPVFAKDVLHVGPHGFGVLRAAPGVGALVVAGYLAVKPIRRRAGVKMLLAVGLYGLATAAFAFSESFVLSVALLAVIGGADMVSVFTRQSLIQLSTPDRMRGRVSAVSTLFIGASNELGEFESGVAAGLFGPVGAVAAGGVGAVLVTAMWAWLFPLLRTADKLA